MQRLADQYKDDGSISDLWAYVVLFFNTFSHNVTQHRTVKLFKTLKLHQNNQIYGIKNNLQTVIIGYLQSALPAWLPPSLSLSNLNLGFGL